MKGLNRDPQGARSGTQHQTLQHSACTGLGAFWLAVWKVLESANTVCKVISLAAENLNSLVQKVSGESSGMMEGCGAGHPPAAPDPPSHSSKVSKARQAGDPAWRWLLPPPQDSDPVCFPTQAFEASGEETAPFSVLAWEQSFTKVFGARPEAEGGEKVWKEASQ